MQVILRNEEDWKSLPDNIFRYKPDSYPCLAVGTWQYMTNCADGYDYDFVYLIDESPDNPEREEKFSIDLTKL